MVPDMTLIQGAVSSLKAASDIAQGFLHLKSVTDVQGKVIELQSAILSAQSSALAAQSAQTTMIQRISDLEKEIADIKAWEKEKQRYQLFSPWGGFHVYALKDSSKGTEPPHWICARCYEDGIKSLLNDTVKWDRRRLNLVQCPRCNFEVEQHGSTERQCV